MTHIGAEEVWAFTFILAGFCVQGATGFGAGIVSLSLGALVLPLNRLIPAFIPLAVCMALVLTIKERSKVDHRVLFRRVFPVVLPSALFGVWVFTRVNVVTLLPFFGVLTVILSSFDLIRSFRAIPEKPMSTPTSVALFAAGGAAHGMFASGGPLIVLSLARMVEDKRTFRATVSAMWVVINGAILATYFAKDIVDEHTLRLTGLFLPALIGGLVLGEFALRRISEKGFRRVVLVIVATAGTILVAKSILAKFGG